MADTIPLLSPYNITDHLMRAELYREIRNGDSSWAQYTIGPDEILFPELIAHRYYGTRNLKWVVMISAKLDSPREPLEAGETILLPPATWIRQRIKHYQGR